MTFPALQSVVSGRPYAVTGVSGRAPLSLEDFIGDVTFTVASNGHSCSIHGSGRLAGPGVRFHEKSGGPGKDLRVWEVTATSDHGFEAQTLSMY